MQLLSPQELKKKAPLDLNLQRSIQTHRQEIQEILAGKDPRFVLILGPCSLHDESSSIEYAQRLKTLQKAVEKTCLLVMRAHIEKPRTYLGWKGLLYDPHLDGSNDIQQGLFICRRILLNLAQIGIPIATEFLDPISSTYFSDLISWGFIGARTSDSQPHRHLASLLPMPIGFKNATDGSLEGAIFGALSAQSSHSFIHVNEMGHICSVVSPGNPFSHIVLRGSNLTSNYEALDVSKTLNLSVKNGLEARLLIDCSHGNSPKNPFHQKVVCKAVLDQYLSGNHSIMGLMIESHLESGNQSFSAPCIDPCISITDPCIDWASTEELVFSVDSALSSAFCIS